MSNIPLDLQRKCDQRWATRFVRLAPSANPQRDRPEGQDQQLAKANGKNRRVETAGLRSAPVV
jgi:hypothetical protein